MKVMYHLLERAGKGNQQIVFASSQQRLHRRPVRDELVLGTNRRLKFWLTLSVQRHTRGYAGRSDSIISQRYF